MLSVAIITIAVIVPAMSLPTRTEPNDEGEYRVALIRESSQRPGERGLDAIGGGHLLRNLETMRLGMYPSRQSRGQTLDSLSGVSFGNNKRLDTLSGIGFGNQKRNFDEIDRSGFNSFIKRNFDEIDRTGFNSFVKKNFDEIDRSGFNSFVKRSTDEQTSTH